MSVHESAKTALRALLDEAEARDYNPPANPIAVAELEWIIAQHTDDKSVGRAASDTQ